MSSSAGRLMHCKFCILASSTLQHLKNRKFGPRALSRTQKIQTKHPSEEHWILLITIFTHISWMVQDFYTSEEHTSEEHTYLYTYSRNGAHKWRTGTLALNLVAYYTRTWSSTTGAPKIPKNCIGATLAMGINVSVCKFLRIAQEQP